MIDLLFERKKFDDHLDLVFKGLRFDDDAAFKYAYFLGCMNGEDSIYVAIQVGDDINRYKVDCNKDVQVDDVPESSGNNKQD